MGSCRSRAFAVALAALVWLAGCYERHLDPCRVTCTDVCPTGSTCGADGYCHAPGEPATCGADAAVADGGNDASDASAPDAAAPDGPDVDGGGDATIDAADLDAGVDAGTAIDATPPDGPLVPGVVTAVSTGLAHTCAVDDQAQLWCWGADDSGQVGDGLAGPRALTPRLVATAVTAIAAGDTHTCAISGGRVLCWGGNLDGEAGQPALGVVATPTEVSGAGTGWTAVAVGAHHSCGIKQISAAEQRLFCWGADRHGARGDGLAVTSGPVPTEAAGGITTWSSLTAAGDVACGVAGGRGYCWGANGAGQLGTGDLVDRDAPTQLAAGDNSSRQYNQLATGGATTCGIHTGALLCWGDNSGGLYGDAAASATAPHQVAAATASWTAVALGPTTACGIRAGAPRCWGAGGRGQIGDGGLVDRPAATAVAGLATASIITVGGAHACAIAAGQAWCWGDNASGQLGDGTASARFAPTVVTATTGWIDVAAADGHTCARRLGAGRTELWCWGYNRARQVDPGATIGAVLAPVELMPTRDWREVAAGRAHTCAIENFGATRALWCWGDDGRGQLGTGAGAGIQAPATIATPAVTTWVGLVAAGDATCALGGTTRYCWGANDRAQLGLGDSVDRGQPTAASGSWQRVALGARFGCGVDDQARLACWGDDGRGQLGLGTGDQSTGSPQVTMTGPVGAVGLGAAHACAAATDARCWGDNTGGQTGHLASTAPVEAPTTVVGTSLWTAVAGGRLHTCALTASGRLACWGDNRRGQLGVDGAASAAPVMVGSATWSSLAVGADHACGVSGGGLFCWGDNAVGQLGLPATARATPVAPLVP